MNIVMFGLAACAVAVGIVVTVVAAPFVAAVVGGAAIGSGVAGLMASFGKEGKETTWKEFGKSMLTGAFVGAVSGLFSWGASAIIAKVGITGISNLVLSCVVRIGTGAGSSIVTNGINNVMNDKGFTENWKQALKTGLIIGTIGAAAEGFRYFCNKAATAQADSLLNAVSKKVSELKDKYIQLVETNCGSFNWVVHGVVEIGKTFLEGGALQLITTGEINWKLLCIGAAIYGGTRLARTAVENRQKQQNDKLVKEAFDDHEAKHEQNVKDAQIMAEKKVEDKLRQARRAWERLDSDAKVGKEREIAQLERELSQIKEGIASNAVRKIQTCTSKMRDPKGNMTTGRNSGQRDHDGKMNPSANTGMDQAHVENPYRDDLPKRYTVKAGETLCVKGKTITAEKPGQMAMTDAEAKAKWPVDWKDRDRGCAEVEMIARADQHNQGKTDLGNSSMMAVGSELEIDKNGMVNNSTHSLRPPCNKGCNEIKFGRNFTRREHLTEQIQRTQVSGEQTFMDVRHESKDNKKKDKSPTCPDGNRKSEKKIEKKILTSLEDELLWQMKLKKEYEESKEEEERLKNDDFIRTNRIREENVYVGSMSRVQTIRAGSGNDKVYTAGTDISKKARLDEEAEVKTSAKTIKKDKPYVKNWLASSLDQDEPKEILTKADRFVETFPIVAWSEKHNKYMMVDHNRWPKPIEGETKLIAFLGVHKSGRTTLLHSLIYQAGYSMTKEQSLITKLGLGINMYVLRELGLIFLDISDSMDTIGDLQKNSTPIASVLLEIFGYLNCDHLVYSLPYGEETEMKEKEAFNNIRSRVEFLFRNSLLVGFGGASHITVVPRQQNIATKTCEQWTQLKDYFEKMQNGTKSAPEAARKDNVSKNNVEDLSKEDDLVTWKHEVKILPVRFFELARSPKVDSYYRRELKQLWKTVKEETSVHPSSKNIDAMAGTSVYGGMITTWNRLTKNKEINDYVAEVSNERMRKQAGRDGRQNAINVYWKNCEDYLQEIPADSSLARAIENYDKERERCSKEYEQVPDDEKDPEMFLRLLLKSGTILIRECLKMEDLSLKEKGLRIGLSVFSALLGQGDKIMDIRLLRLGIVDLDLMDLLNDRLIYMHYLEAWVIFYYMVVRGLRFHLLKIPLWAAMEKILTRKDELIPEKMKIYYWTVHTLLAMMDLDEMSILPSESHADRLDDDKLYLASYQRIQLDYDYRLYSEDQVKQLFDKTIEKPQSAADNYIKLIEMPENFYNNHEICENTGIFYKDLHINCKDQFARVTFNHFHKQCALHFAQKIFEKEVLYALKQLGNEEVVILRIKVLKKAVGVVAEDGKLAPLLLKSDLPHWLLDNFLLDRNCSFDVYCQAASFASEIIFNQDSLQLKVPKETNRERIYTLVDVQKRERKECQVKSYGIYRLLFLEAGCQDIAVAQLQRYFDSSLPETDVSNATILISFIIRLIVIAIDEDDRKNFVDLFIVKKRQLLVDQMTQLVLKYADLVDFAFDGDEQSKGTHGYLIAVLKALDFVSCLMWSYYANDFDNFFGSRDTQLWKMVTSIVTQVFFKVIRPWREVGDRLPKNIEKCVESVLGAFVCLSLNVSSTSGITFNEVKRVMAQDKVGTLANSKEENPRQKSSNPEIIRNMNNLPQLKLEEPGYDLNNVERAAYIIDSSDRNIYKHFKDLASNLVQTAKRLKYEEEESHKRLELATTRRKRFEDKRPVASAGPSYADRMSSQPSTSSSVLKPVTVACDGIFIKTSLLPAVRLPRKDWEDFLFGELLEVYQSEAAAHAYMLLVTNSSDAGKQKLERFIEYLRELLDIEENKTFTIESDEVFVSLKWMPLFLSFVKYCQVWRNSGEVWIISLDRREELTIVYDILKEYLSRQREIALKLDTNFITMEAGITEESYQEQTLPEEFFSSRDTTVVTRLKKKTISELIKNKREYVDELREEQFNYILVRVEVSSYRRNVYQAVFNRYMPLSSVLDNLKIKGVAVSKLKLKSTSAFLEPSRALGDLGSIALYLYGL